MDIETIREHVKRESIVWRNHVLVRMRQRNIRVVDVLNCILTGEIIEGYPNDYPFESALVFGKAVDNKDIHVVCSVGESRVWFITAYFPDPAEWYPDNRTRRD